MFSFQLVPIGVMSASLVSIPDSLTAGSGNPSTVHYARRDGDTGHNMIFDSPPLWARVASLHKTQIMKQNFTEF